MAKNNNKAVVWLLAILVGAVIFFWILVPAWNRQTVTQDAQHDEQVASNAVAQYQLDQMEAELAALKADQATEPDVDTGTGDDNRENGGTVVVPQNDLVNPEPHHGDSQPPENGPGSFDVGVKPGQIGVVFGYHIAWPKGNLDAGGGGCDLVILTTGWYENLQITDARYEVYDVPSSDYSGWVEVLGQQRADEQAADYGCPAKDFSELPQWESPFPSPPVTVQ